jgi:putative endonuclease
MPHAPPGPDPRRQLGRLAEALAGDHLTASGLDVVARNWRCRHGEIDLVATAPGLVVFCEVKARRGSAYGTPAAAVTTRKQARLRALAAAWLATTGHPPSRVRFDVIAVQSKNGVFAVMDALWAAARRTARPRRTAATDGPSQPSSRQRAANHRHRRGRRRPAWPRHPSLRPVASRSRVGPTSYPRQHDTSRRRTALNCGRYQAAWTCEALT